MKKDNKTKDELDNLLESMKAENSMPDKDFEEDLRYEVLKKSGKKFAPSRSFLGIKWNFGLAVVLLLVFATAAIGIQTVSYLFGNTNPGSSKSTVLSSDQKDEFLSNVIQNNSQGILTTTYEAPPASPQTDSKSQLPAETTANSIVTADTVEKQKEQAVSTEKSYSYSKTLTTVYAGPSSDKCSAFADTENWTSESYEYVDKDTNTYYFKYISKDKDGGLLDYYLDNENEFITYFGGKYAVQELKDQKVSDNAVNEGAQDGQKEQQTYTEEELINSYFGADAQVEKLDGNYVIKYEMTYNCGTDENPDNKTIVYVSKVSGSDFSLLESNFYFETVSDSNLLSGSKYESTREDRTFDEVKDTFKFDYDAELRDINDYTLTYLEREQSLMAYLKDSNFKLLMPEGAADFSYVYVTYYDLDTTLKNYTYLADRDFYPEGEKGQTRYTSEQGALSLEPEEQRFSVFSDFSGADTNVTYYITYYAKEMSDSNILNLKGLSVLDAQESAGKIKISGKETAANFYKFADMPENPEYAVFNFDGKKILLEIYDTVGDLDPSSFELTIKDMTKEADQGTIDTLLKSQFTGLENQIYSFD